jgi:hypothetical protein
MFSKQWLRYPISAAIIVIAVLLAVSSKFYSEAMVSAFFAASLLSATIVLLFIGPSLAEIAGAVVLACVIGLIDYSLLDFRYFLVAPISFVGIASLAVLGASGPFVADPHRRSQRMLSFIGCLGFVVSTYMADSLHHLTEAFHAYVLDLRLNSFDASLGLQPAFVMGQIFVTHPWLRAISLLFYILLSVPVAVVFGGWLRKDLRRARGVLIAFLIVGPIGIIFYNLLPALGPVHVFGQGFPLFPMPLEAARTMLSPVRGAGPRNAIPSLHFAWVVLAWWLSRGLHAAIRSVCLVFIIFTFLATLGTGEHYFVDLVVALPFAMFIEALVEWGFRDRTALQRAFIAVGMVVVWLLLLSFATPLFWKSALVPWLLVAATIGGVLWVRQQARPKGIASVSVRGGFESIEER